MKNYTEIQYIEMINDYFNNFSSRALLLEGEWGSGKTYFVNNKFKESLTDKDVFIYLSLYGKHNIDQVYEDYLDCVLKDKYLKKLTGKSLANMSIKMLDYLKKSNNFIDTFLDKEDLKDLIQNDKVYYIVLDDLERCSIELSVLLGFINSLTEQKNKRVLVIANENEIGKTSINSNLPQKYITSLLAEKIVVENPDHFNFLSETNNKISSITTTEELKLKTNAIFNESDKNYVYLSFKEKTFGKTITFFSKIDLIFTEKINEIINEEEKEFFVDNRELIIDEFKRNNICNLRILETSLKTIMRFEFVFNHFKLYNKFDDFKKVFIKSIIISEIYHSLGKEKQTVGKRGDYSEAPEPINIYLSYTAFKFLEDYVWNSIIDEQYVLSVLKSFFLVLYIDIENSTLNRIRLYWKMEDDEIEKSIEQLIDELKESKYPPSLFEMIFTSLINLKEIGFNIDVDNILKLMRYSKNRDIVPYDQYSEFKLSLNVNISDKYNNYFDEIRKIKRKFISYNNKSFIDDVFSNKSWGHQFYIKYNENKDLFYDSRQFLSYLNIDEILENLGTSSNANFAEFISSINTIYKDGYLTNDKNHIFKIYDYLKNKTFQSKIKESNRIKALEILERIKSNY